jgi:hypothetical protein
MNDEGLMKDGGGDRIEVARYIVLVEDKKGICKKVS